MSRDLQDLYHRFGGVPDTAENRRFAWYGQARAKGLSHDEAVEDTARHHFSWIFEVWPKRGIEIPEHLYPDGWKLRPTPKGGE